jgi:adenylylsulfate kinase-like enzyme
VGRLGGPRSRPGGPHKSAVDACHTRFLPAWVSMIVWINGAYGSGKTTLVAEITRRRSEAVVFDPELIGSVMRESIPVPTDNVQDLPSWREIVVAAVLSFQRHHANLLLVPMTLINPAYRREVLGALRVADVELLEVFLDVPADELRRRIEHRVLFDDPVRDADAREFCLSMLEEGVAAAGRVDRDTLVLQAGTLSPGRLAQAVLDRTAATD